MTLTISIREVRPELDLDEINDASFAAYLEEVRAAVALSYPDAAVEVDEARPGAIRSTYQIDGIEDDQAIRNEIDECRREVWDRAGFWC